MPEITEIKAVERTVEIVHPSTKLPIGLRFGMVSLQDDRLEKVKKNIREQALNNERRGKSWKVEDIDHNKNRLMFAACTGWEWYDATPENERGAGYKEDPATFHGVKPEWNIKNFIDVSTELPWVREQLDEELGDTEAFFALSKSN